MWKKWEMRREKRKEGTRRVRGIGGGKGGEKIRRESQREVLCRNRAKSKKDMSVK